MLLDNQAVQIFNKEWQSYNTSNFKTQPFYPTAYADRASFKGDIIAAFRQLVLTIVGDASSSVEGS